MSKFIFAKQQILHLYSKFIPTYWQFSQKESIKGHQPSTIKPTINQAFKLHTVSSKYSCICYFWNTIKCVLKYVRSFPCFTPVCDELSMKSQSLLLQNFTLMGLADTYLPLILQQKVKIGSPLLVVSPIVPPLSRKTTKGENHTIFRKNWCYCYGQQSKQFSSPVTLFVTAWRIRNLSKRHSWEFFFTVYCINLKKSVNWEPKDLRGASCFPGYDIKIKNTWWCCVKVKLCKAVSFAKMFDKTKSCFLLFRILLCDFICCHGMQQLKSVALNFPNFMVPRM